MYLEKRNINCFNKQLEIMACVSKLARIGFC